MSSLFNVFTVTLSNDLDKYITLTLCIVDNLTLEGGKRSLKVSRQCCVTCLIPECFNSVHLDKEHWHSVIIIPAECGTFCCTPDLYWSQPPGGNGDTLANSLIVQYLMARATTIKHKHGHCFPKFPDV